MALRLLLFFMFTLGVAIDAAAPNMRSKQSVVGLFNAANEDAAAAGGGGGRGGAGTFLSCASAMAADGGGGTFCWLTCAKGCLVGCFFGGCCCCCCVWTW